MYSDRLFEPIKSNADSLIPIIEQIGCALNESKIDVNEWANSPYRPTPTIIEAAQALYRGHDVTEISRSDAGAINLSRTAASIDAAIAQAKANDHKAICFITGVPGSGKTLAGLNIANQRHNIDEGEHAVFLSGNGPLVAVLREALARSNVEQAASRQEVVSIGAARSKAAVFIQNIHHFRDDNFQSTKAPFERVVVFDEAQRAWTQDQTSKFMRDKRGARDFEMSEPEYLISVMNRHSGYAVVVCLVGGGQEINTGEAGLPEWFNALRKRFPEWKIYVSSRLDEFEYTRGTSLYTKIELDRVITEPNLHLGVSLRSFRAETVSGFVKDVLDGNVELAKEKLSQIADNYPILLTRDLDKARTWLKWKARGTERFGIVASSGALRLKPEGLNVKSKIDPVNWFLNDKSDVRSSYYLEDVATEFDAQGLELDWVCVAWDGNFFRKDEIWAYRKFSGTKWKSVKNAETQIYMKNAYRVLLTRARQGMVIYVPKGSVDDPTRDPRLYDSIAKYLAAIGIRELRS